MSTDDERALALGLSLRILSDALAPGEYLTTYNVTPPGGHIDTFWVAEVFVSSNTGSGTITGLGESREEAIRNLYTWMYRRIGKAQS